MWKIFGGIGSVVVAVAVYWTLREDNKIKTDPAQLRDTYDYVIVGGGTAGSVLAARLSENSAVSVLLLEAGSSTENYRKFDIPAFASDAHFTDIDWQFKTVPQRNACLGLKDQVSNWPAGKVLGGSSFINFMTYVRGNPKDFDIWQSLGNPGWNYQSVLPYFIKHEKAVSKGMRVSELRGKDGPINVIKAEKTIFGSTFLRAIKNSGMYNKNKDYNGEYQEGFSRHQRSIGGGSRQSAVSEYLMPVISRPNLDVLVNAYVTKVLFDGSKKASGVEFQHGSDGARRKVHASRDIILSAGAMKTAHLLMLSGIGPKAELEKFEIPVIADLPVGQYMQAHLAVDLNFKLNTSIGFDFDELSSLSSRLMWHLFGKGAWEQLGPDIIGFVKSPFADEDGVPDIQYLVFPYSIAPLFMKIQSMSDETAKAYKGVAKAGERSFSVLCINNHALSKGRVWLQSKDPAQPPMIDPNYLHEQQDVDVLAFGLARFITLTLLPELAQYGAEIAEAPLPGCESLELCPWTI